MTNLLESPNNITETTTAREAIKTLRSAMEPGTKQETFWRGSPSEITEPIAKPSPNSETTLTSTQFG